jgi:hypothetical protein
LAIWGRNDPYFVPDGAYAYGRRRTSRGVVLLDTGHFALEEDVDAVAAAVDAFLCQRPRLTEGHGRDHSQCSGPTITPASSLSSNRFSATPRSPLVSRQAGLMGQHVGRPLDQSTSEYLYVTMWKNVESIRAFAGERWQEAVITLDDVHLLKAPGSRTTKGLR